MTHGKINWLIALSIIVLVAISILAIMIYDENNENRLHGSVSDLVLYTSRNECYSKGLVAEVCDNLGAEVFTTECEGRACWIVHVKEDNGTFFATAVVQELDGELNIIKYKPE